MNHANSINYKLKVRTEKKHPINLPPTTTTKTKNSYIKKMLQKL